MAYWLMKSEPSAYSIGDLKHEGSTYWDGVRNYQARNYMRAMQINDLAFFYHSNCKVPGIVGMMKISRTAYTDHTAFDPDDHHYDPKSDPDRPRWQMVDVAYLQSFQKTVSLSQLRATPGIEEMIVLRKGNRLSITPLTDQEWKVICQLAEESKC